MNHIKKQSFKKRGTLLLIAPLIAMQATNAFANCATAYNNCVSAAGNNYDSCTAQADSTRHGCEVGAAVIALINPPLGAALLAGCLAKSASDINNCGTAYDAAVQNCQDVYDSCHDE